MFFRIQLFSVNDIKVQSNHNQLKLVTSIHVRISKYVTLQGFEVILSVIPKDGMALGTSTRHQVNDSLPRWLLFK